MRQWWRRQASMQCSHVLHEAKLHAEISRRSPSVGSGDGPCWVGVAGMRASSAPVLHLSSFSSLQACL